MKKPLVVTKSNKIIESSYRLTLNEQRLILACIAQIKKDRVISADDRFEVSAVNFAGLFQMNVNQAYRELQEVAERLYQRSVTIQNPDPDDPRITHTKTRWVSSIDYVPQQGVIIVRFASRMIPYISLLEGSFKRYQLDAVAGMSSVYGIRFYELFMQWIEKGEREMALVDLKQLLDLTGQYSAIKDFKKYVIEPAMQDINEHSDLQASYSQRKTGRCVSHFLFKFQRKNAPKPPMQTLNAMLDLVKPMNR